MHLPLSFLFDMRSYPSRICPSSSRLDKLLDPSAPFDVSSDVPNISLETIYSNVFFKGDYSESLKMGLKYSAEYEDPNLADGSSQNYEALRSAKINQNTSFLLEEYLSLISRMHFDEQRFYKFSPLDSTVDENEYQKFVKKISGGSTNVESKSSQIDTFLVQDVKSIKQSLVTPRKFDRVFHMIFDPDDFYVDAKSTDILKYASQGIIKNTKDGWKRTDTEKSSFSFDSYFVTAESYDDL
jgi:hypothetical protein